MGSLFYSLNLSSWILMIWFLCLENMGNFVRVDVGLYALVCLIRERLSEIVVKTTDLNVHSKLNSGMEKTSMGIVYSVQYVCD